MARHGLWRQTARTTFASVASCATAPATRQIVGRATDLARIGGAAVADFLVPPVCIACRVHVTSHRTLCPTCWANVDFIRAPICDTLGIPLPFDTGERTVSAAALAAPPVFDRARAAALHTDVMRGLIHGLKYGDRTDGVDVFGRWLATAVSDLIADTDVIIPVPLNRWRLWKRRFNQSALLAHALAKETGVPADTLALIRVRRTRSQVGLTLNQRRTNVSGAFRVPEAKRDIVRGKSVLLVDDVMTTGSTVDASTRALRRAGALCVNVVTLARVVEPVQPTALMPTEVRIAAAPFNWAHSVLMLWLMLIRARRHSRSTENAERFQNDDHDLHGYVVPVLCPGKEPAQGQTGGI